MTTPKSYMGYTICCCQNEQTDGSSIIRTEAWGVTGVTSDQTGLRIHPVLSNNVKSVSRFHLNTANTAGAIRGCTMDDLFTGHFGQN